MSTHRTASTEVQTFSVWSHLCPAVWRFTDESGERAAREYYAEVHNVPVSSVGIGRRTEV